MGSVRRPTRILVAPGPVRALHGYLTRGNVHDKNVKVPWFKSSGPCESNVLAIGAPRGIHRVAFTSGQADNICTINIHSIYLRSASAPVYEHKVVPGLRIHLRLDVQRPGMG